MVEGARRVLHRFGAEWRAQPRRARRRWLAVLGGGLLVSWGVMAALVLWMERLDRAGRLAWEAGALREVARVSPLSFSSSIWGEAPGNALLLIPLLGAVAVACVWRGWPLRGLSLLVAFFVLDAVVGLGWLLWDRARPQVIAGGIAAPGLHSFPSGHVSQTLAGYGALAWLWVRLSPSGVERAAAVVFVVAVTALVSLARLRLGSHWPTDVAAGWVVGALWLAVVAAAQGAAERAGGR